MQNQSQRHVLALIAALGGLATLGGCGGGSASDPISLDASASSSSLPVAGTAGTATSAAQANFTTTASPSTATPLPLPVVAPSQALPLLPVPTNIANGTVVALECGRTYRGTMDLKGKSRVTVRTSGTCGNAVITPGEAISGWTKHQGNIYSAPVAFNVAQVLIDGQPQTLAHWPNRPQSWAKASSSSAASLSYGMPNADLAGARLVFKPYEWAVEARTITGYSGSTMSLASTGNINFDGYGLQGAVDFYVEGKLWMLDSPGEWAVSNGRLYVWAPDGQSPEGRVWAAPDKDGIDASGSNGITLEGISIVAAANGVNAMNASNLKATNVDIANSSSNGILNSGGSGLQVEGGSIRNTRHDAIAVKWGGGAETIRNVRIDASGTIGMPTNVHAAINLTAGSGAVVQGNAVTNAGYIGIRVFRNASVSNNTVDGACLVLTDCGGIFTSAPDKAALNTRIEGNTIRNVGRNQRLAWALYLGDYANGVTVAGNTASASGNGMEILNGFNNVVSGNTFSQSTQSHIQFVEFGSAATVTNNRITGNTFVSAQGEETYRMSSERGTSAVGQFGTYDNNTYRSSSAVFANYNGEALSFAQWKARTGQDASSVLQQP